MAHIFTDSFLFYTATGDLARRYEDVSTSGVAFSDTLGRFGGRCLVANPAATSGRVVKTFPGCGDTTGNAFFFSLAFWATTIPAGTGSAKWMRIGTTGAVANSSDGTDAQIAFRFKTDGALEAYRGTTLIATSAAASLVASTWYRIEGKLYLHDSAGRLIVKMNGVTVIDFTGDTLNGTVGTTVGSFLLALGQTITGGISGETWRVQDIMLWNGGGAAPNDFVGDFVITPAFPNANGATVDGTTVGVANAWDAVNDQGFPASPDADYQKLSTTGNIDLFAHAALSLTGVIGVQVHAYARGDGPGTKQMQLAVRSGGTNYFSGTDLAVPGQSFYLSRDAFFATDPNTAVAWTGSGVDNAQFGYKLTG